MGYIVAHDGGGKRCALLDLIGRTGNRMLIGIARGAHIAARRQPEMVPTLMTIAIHAAATPAAKAPLITPRIVIRGPDRIHCVERRPVTG